MFSSLIFQMFRSDFADFRTAESLKTWFNHIRFRVRDSAGKPAGGHRTAISVTGNRVWLVSRSGSR